MDKYYCPNCGATLNDQYGFDPSKGTWTCTSCGELLMDDDVYDGDSYTGVAWFCDKCGALLNKQSGFSDSLGSWTCTECGHQNGTTEDDIVDDSFICPNCGANLKTQFCYSEYDDDWECTECGKRLHRDYSFDPYMAIDDEGNDNEEDECSNAKSYHSYHYNISRDFMRSNSKKSFWKKNWWRVLLSIPIGVLSIYLVIIIMMEFKRIPVGYTSLELYEQNYEDVRSQLEASGFVNIECKPLDDLVLSDEWKTDTVYRVIISDNDIFDDNAKYSKYSSIIIEYHTLKSLNPPINSKKAKGENYLDIYDMFSQSGFVNIKYEIEYDLINGWITKDGSVKEVSINGNSKYSLEDVFRPDAEIIITYHTYKKDKP